MDALIIKKEFLDKIFSVKKTWEIRGSRTHNRGIIGLIESESSMVVGVCELVDCKMLSADDFKNNFNKYS